MPITALTTSLLGMIFDNIVINVSLVAANFPIHAFSNWGILANYFYNKVAYIANRTDTS